MKSRTGYNPKRKIAPLNAMEKKQRDDLAKRSKYDGNPEHKRNPGDFGLTPPTSPRPGKTLCDAVGVTTKTQSKHLLAEGITKGMVSETSSNGWPKNVWAVSDEGEVFEAQLGNREQGIYHGYPLPNDDDFRQKVLVEWYRR